jgi:hypothetical protein
LASPPVPAAVIEEEEKREKSPESVISVDRKSNFGRDLFHPQEDPITNKQLHELTTATMKKNP